MRNLGSTSCVPNGKPQSFQKDLYLAEMSQESITPLLQYRLHGAAGVGTAQIDCPDLCMLTCQLCFWRFWR